MIAAERLLFRVVKDDAKRVSVSRAQTAHAVPQRYAVDASRALYGPGVHSKHDGIAFAQRHYFCA